MDIIVRNNLIFLSVTQLDYCTEKYLAGSRKYYYFLYKILFDILIVKDQLILYDIFYIHLTLLFLGSAVTVPDYNSDYFTAPENIQYLTFGGSFKWFSAKAYTGLIAPSLKRH